MAVIPGDTELNLKGLAAASGDREIHLVPVKDAGSRASLSRLVRRCVLRALSLTKDPSPSRITRKSYGPRVPEPWLTPNDHVLLCCFGTDRLRRQEEMKTAGRENQNHWGKVAGNRAHRAEVQSRTCSIMWAAKQEKIRPLQECFFLTFLFMEPTEAHRLHSRRRHRPCRKKGLSRLRRPKHPHTRRRLDLSRHPRLANPPRSRRLFKTHRSFSLHNRRKQNHRP